MTHPSFESLKPKNSPPSTLTSSAFRTTPPSSAHSHATVATFEEIKLPSRTDLHLVRKLWHVCTGLLGLYGYWTFKQVPFLSWGVFFVGLGLLAYAIETVRLKTPWLNHFITKVFAPFLRQSEKNSVSGLPFYALGCGLSVLLYREEIAILSILFLVFGDPISSTVGILYGKDKIYKGKSLQGSLAGFVVCYLITLIYCLALRDGGLHFILFAFFGGIIGSLAELFSQKIDDNLMIPLASGLGLTFFNMIFKIF